jgi:ribosomal protein S18 acetylase RimI-like enzyme
MGRTEEWIKEKGINEIELHVYEFNQKAIIFYKKLGYKTRSRRIYRRY